MRNAEADSFYSQTFIPRAHRLGIATLVLGLVFSLLPAFYLSFVVGAWPGFEAVLRAFIPIAAFVGVIWIIEPLSYFPMLGVAGTYMSFLSGNIGNMRLPVVIGSQTAVNAELGTKKAEVVAVIGIAVSVLINLVFVLAMVLLGNLILNHLPQFAIDMLKNYTLPSIYAAVFMMFLGAAKESMHVLVVIVVALIVVALPISEIVNVTAAGVGGILASLLVARFSSGRSEKA
ncbi:hypothetical protein [Thauera sp. WH-1]|uniref:hypothetical protein n=1 Tax=Thauera sp. WH-1 TaxID=3398230 RepID=UPI0039FD8D46